MPAPLLFNIYTNDQPLIPGTRSFIYADDRATLTYGKKANENETKLSKTLDILGDYHHENHVNENPTKTVSSLFHLNNRQSNMIINLQWDGTNIKQDTGPKYIGVTLDRCLTVEVHCVNVAGKIQSLNNLLSRLVTCRWRASPCVMRTTALALCFSVAEYACHAWLDSTHAKKVNVALNETCHTRTGCMRNTSTDQLYGLSGIAPPLIRRKSYLVSEKTKQETNERHPLYNAAPADRRLKSQ